MRRRKNPYRIALLLAAAFTTAAESQEAPATEQQPDQVAARQDRVVFDTIDVQVVNLEVFVTDKKGNRITDLGKDDFEIYEDRRLMPITNFYAVASRRDRTARDLPLLEVEEPEVETPAPERTTPPDQRLRVVVFIDNDNINPLNRNRFFAHLRSFLSSNLERDDQIAVYTYERALHLKVPLTPKISDAFDAFDEIERTSGRGNSKTDERRDLLRDIDRAQSLIDVTGKVKMYARSIRTDVEFTIRALGEMVSSLAGLPGRKAVLYVSDGLPLRAGEDLYAAMAERFEDPTLVTEVIEFDASRDFNELSARANANQVTFYTISAAGLRAHGDAGADVSMSPSYGQINTIRRLNFAAPLESLAEETGGLAIVGTSNFQGGLGRIAEDFGGYYSLGYTPAHGGDGRYYEVKVKVKRKGLEVRHRQGYRAKTPQVRMSELTMAALNYGEVTGNPLELDLALEPASRGEDRLYLQPLVLRVPIRNVVLAPQESVHLGRLKVFLAAIDKQGRLVSIDDQPWPIQIPDDKLERAMAMTFAHEVTLSMRPGKHRIAVGVRDELGAEESFVTREVFLGGGPG